MNLTQQGQKSMSGCPEIIVATNPEYTNTQQDLPDQGYTQPLTRHARLYGQWGCFAEKQLQLDPYFQCFSHIFCIERLLSNVGISKTLMWEHYNNDSKQFHHLSLLFQIYFYEATKRSRPSYPRDTANRFVLTLQGEPNQHGTHLPRRMIRANHSPPCLELQNRPTYIQSAELNERQPKVNTCIPILRDYSTRPKGW